MTFDRLEKTIWRSRYASPLGTLFMASLPSGLVDIAIGAGEAAFIKRLEANYGSRGVRDDKRFNALFRKLDKYFRGDRVSFDIPLAPQGTKFEISVWNVLRRIPYGQTLGYGEVALRAGLPGGARAVGNACGKNPMPIVIPCHRVLKGDGSLGGYTGGVSIKKALLELEGIGL